MWHQIKSAIENRFDLALVVAFTVGLLWPGLAAAPNWVIILAMAMAIFFASSKISAHDFSFANIREGVAFYGLRFLILPVILFYIFAALWPDLSQVVLLYALAPAGVTTPALAGLLGGNAGLAMGQLFLSSALAPYVIPGVFELVGDQQVAPDTIGMLINLLIMVVLPLAVYFLVFRRWRAGDAFVREQVSFATVLLMMLAVAIVIARKREYLIADPGMVLGYAAIMSLLQLLFYLVGWFYAYRQKRAIRITYALNSGAPNLALAIALAFIFLPNEAGLILVIAEIPWILGVAVFKRFLISR